MRLGLRYQDALSLPHGELLDLIAVEQVKHEGFRLVEAEPDIWEILGVE